MKLSEAIKLGSILRPQAFGGTYSLRERPMHQNSVLGLIAYERVASCAMGAALEAAGCATRKALQADDSRPLRGQAQEGAPVEIICQPEEWNAVLYHETCCPHCDGRSESVYRLIPHLNDDHLWPREAIAAWVESLERALTSCTPTQRVSARNGDPNVTG